MKRYFLLLTLFSAPLVNFPIQSSFAQPTSKPTTSVAVVTQAKKLIAVKKYDEADKLLNRTITSLQAQFAKEKNVSNRNKLRGDLADVYRLHASLMFDVDDLPNSIYNYRKAHDIDEKLRRKEVADDLYGMGRVYFHNDQKLAALHHLEMALASYRKSKNRKGESDTLFLIQDVYSYNKDYKNAIFYGERALAVTRQMKDRHLEADMLNIIGSEYQNMKDYKNAIAYFNRSIALSRTLKHQEGTANALFNLGLAYLALKDYTKAKNTFDQSLSLFVALKDRAGEASSLRNISSIYIHHKQDKLAIANLERAATIYKATDSPIQEAEMLDLLMQLYIDTKQPKLAMERGLALVKKVDYLRANAENGDDTFEYLYEASFQELAQLLTTQGRSAEATSVRAKIRP